MSEGRLAWMAVEACSIKAHRANESQSYRPWWIEPEFLQSEVGMGAQSKVV